MWTSFTIFPALKALKCTIHAIQVSAFLHSFSRSNMNTLTYTSLHWCLLIPWQLTNAEPLSNECLRNMFVWVWGYLHEMNAIEGKTQLKACYLVPWPFLSLLKRASHVPRYANMTWDSQLSIRTIMDSRSRRDHSPRSLPSPTTRFFAIFVHTKCLTVN